MIHAIWLREFISIFQYSIMTHAYDSNMSNVYGNGWAVLCTMRPYSICKIQNWWWERYIYIYIYRALDEIQYLAVASKKENERHQGVCNALEWFIICLHFPILTRVILFFLSSHFLSLFVFIFAKWGKNNHQSFIAPN